MKTPATILSANTQYSGTYINGLIYCSFIALTVLLTLCVCDQEETYSLCQRDFLETIEKPTGQGQLFRIQHEDRTVTGSRTILEYLDMVLGDTGTTGDYMYMYIHMYIVHCLLLTM